MTNIAMYGKARVGHAVVALGRSVGLDIALFDDADGEFDPNQFDIVIPTPWVSPTNRAFRAGNTLAELDFAASFLPTGWQILSVTGTDGKSTTCSILAQILTNLYGSDRVYLSGNFEIPLSEMVMEIRSSGIPPGYLVVEVSSFMAHELGKTELLQKIPGSTGNGFTPDIGIFTNIAPDHLNWHGDMRSYYQAKFRLFERSKKSIVRDQVVVFAKKHTFPYQFQNVRIFGGDSPDHLSATGDIILQGGAIYLQKDLSLSGEHNAYNILASILAAKELQADDSILRKTLKELTTLPHRLELVCEKDWVQYIDDSKSTSSQSLTAALSSFTGKKIHLIAGGSDKGDEFLSLVPLVRETCSSITGIGATREKFREVASLAWIPFDIAEDMQGAVLRSSSLAQTWEIVLLSPGCASFGLFRDYLDRATQFRHFVSLIS